MNLRLARWIDRNIGVLLCFIIFIFDRLSHTVKSNPQNKLSNPEVKKILVIKFLGFGSIIMAADAFRSLRNNYPAGRISALTLRQNKPVYEMSGFFDEIIAVDFASPFKFLSQMANAIFKIRKASYDVTIDFEFTSRFSAITTYLSKAKRRIGFVYQGVWRGGCFTDEVNFKEDRRLNESFLDLIKPIAGVGSLPPMRLHLDIKAYDREFIDNLLEEEGLINKNPLVGINVNASELCLLRRWPKEYFVELSGELIKKYSAHLIFIGNKQDSSYVNEVIKGISNKDYISDFSAKTTFTQLACLLSKLNLFITNDSGPLHLAVCLDTPTVSFFGPETPGIYGPEGDSHIVFYKKLSCSPCIRVKNYKHFECTNDRACLREIKPPEVINEIERKGILR